MPLPTSDFFVLPPIDPIAQISLIIGADPTGRAGGIKFGIHQISVTTASRQMFSLTSKLSSCSDATVAITLDYEAREELGEALLLLQQKLPDVDLSNAKLSGITFRTTTGRESTRSEVPAFWGFARLYSIKLRGHLRGFYLSNAGSLGFLFKNGMVSKATPLNEEQLHEVGANQVHPELLKRKNGE
ncbi:hypothetical protein EX30DRAFT_344653 [Ascodesmis nigricans]|uniref:Uncharacterized protein n=1 Tax=Ascodesmis nigricans TaxID=341454 RepID=A0A4S2MIX4_9PEZI|nr:hypothetical protein EX30DRAFT_344653 [Ascodesmis nigricans]